MTSSIPRLKYFRELQPWWKGRFYCTQNSKAFTGFFSHNRAVQLAARKVDVAAGEGPGSLPPPSRWTLKEFRSSWRHSMMRYHMWGALPPGDSGHSGLPNPKTLKTKRWVAELPQHLFSHSLVSHNMHNSLLWKKNNKWTVWKVFQSCVKKRDCWKLCNIRVPSGDFISGYRLGIKV